MLIENVCLTLSTPYQVHFDLLVMVFNQLTIKSHRRVSYVEYNMIPVCSIQDKRKTRVIKKDI